MASGAKAKCCRKTRSWAGEGIVKPKAVGALTERRGETIRSPLGFASARLRITATSCVIGPPAPLSPCASFSQRVLQQDCPLLMLPDRGEASHPASPRVPAYAGPALHHHLPCAGRVDTRQARPRCSQTQADRAPERAVPEET
jgi:hypothetical protein